MRFSLSVKLFIFCSVLATNRRHLAWAQTSAVSVDGLSTVSNSVPQTDVSVDGLSTVSVSPTVITVLEISVVETQVSTFDATYLQNGSTFVEPATITLIQVIPATYTITLSDFETGTAVSSSSSPSSSASESLVTSGRKSHGGAIAGAVVGSIAFAAIAAFLFVRFRRQSPRHWRNRSTGKWYDLEGEPSSGLPSVYVGKLVDRPFDGNNRKLYPVTNVQVESTSSPVVIAATQSPLAPLLIRDTRRPAADDPFADASAPFAQAHRRNASSFSSAHYRTDSSTYIEMVNANSGSTAGEKSGATALKESSSEMAPGDDVGSDVPAYTPF